MPAIIALVLIAILALAAVSVAVHLLFSPWLLVAAVAGARELLDVGAVGLTAGGAVSSEW